VWQQSTGEQQIEAGDVHILGLILAGGRSERMGQDKTLVELAGRPMLAHVCDRFGPQVDALILNSNAAPSQFQHSHLPLLPDEGESMGPLSGLLAGLTYARARGAQWLALVPIDAPLLPRDLIPRLLAAIGQNDVAIARSTHIEPMFSLWSCRAEAQIRRRAETGERALYRIAADLRHVYVDFESDEGFLNVNTQEELARAHHLLHDKS